MIFDYGKRTDFMQFLLVIFPYRNCLSYFIMVIELYPQFGCLGEKINDTSKNYGEIYFQLRKRKRMFSGIFLCFSYIFLSDSVKYLTPWIHDFLKG